MRRGRGKAGQPPGAPGAGASDPQSGTASDSASSRAARIDSRSLSASEQKARKNKMLQTPETITSEVLAFCQSIAPGSLPPVYVPVILEKRSRYLHPYRNVLAAIEATGVGQACTGWSIWEIPNVCLKAEHHCLWDGSDGRGPHDIGTYVLERRLLFLPDPAATFGPGQNEWPRAAYYTALQHDSLIFEYLGTMMMQEE